ncbi:hypothetical protein AB1A20_24190, partial [Escherichia coli]
AEAATTDIKTLEQLLKNFRSVVNERREEYYQEIGEKIIKIIWCIPLQFVHIVPKITFGLFNKLFCRNKFYLHILLHYYLG